MVHSTVRGWLNMDFFQLFIALSQLTNLLHYHQCMPLPEHLSTRHRAAAKHGEASERSRLACRRSAPGRQRRSKGPSPKPHVNGITKPATLTFPCSEHSQSHTRNVSVGPSDISSTITIPSGCRCASSMSQQLHCHPMVQDVRPSD